MSGLIAMLLLLVAAISFALGERLDRLGHHARARPLLAAPIVLVLLAAVVLSGVRR